MGFLVGLVLADKFKPDAPNMIGNTLAISLAPKLVITTILECRL